MKVIFGIAILTAKDIDALNTRIEAVERATERNEYRIAKLRGGLTNFTDKFNAAMDFIGRNLPQKRKRKAFRKIVEA